MVKLAEVVNQMRRRVSEGTNLVQNPFQMAWQWGRKQAMLLYGKASLSGSKDTQTDSVSSNPASSHSTTDNSVNSLTTDAPITEERVLTERTSSMASHPKASKDIQQSGYNQQQSDFTSQVVWEPTLQPGERLQGGWWGVYTIKSCLYAQDWLRCYDGLQDNGSEPVWIYEYFFDRDNWSEEDIDERKRRFKHLIDLNLRLGQGSDFRIIRPKDVINPAGNRVYLITRPLPQSFTLGEFIAKQPRPWSRPQIERFLHQVLQSLQYLQTYLVNWPGDRWEQKLSHGNLSYEHLWIRLPDHSIELNEHPFFIYLGRFSLWEQLFWPQQVPVAQNNGDIGSIDEDLKALGHITFDLIRGYQSNDDPTDLSLWPNDNSIRALYPYVLQLLTYGDSGRFKSIESAISVLQALPDTYSPPLVEEQPAEIVEETIENSETGSWELPLLLLGGGLLLGLLTWIAWAFKRPSQPIIACEDSCRLEHITQGDGTPLKYGIEASSSWVKGFNSTLTSPLKTRNPYVTELQQTLQERDPNFLLEKVHPTLLGRDLLLEYLRTEILDAALMQNAHTLPTDMEKRVVAHDGLAIFVAHSDAQRDASIPKRINGRISLQKLRKLLLDPKEKLDGARVQLYWPKDDVTISLLRDALFDSDGDKVAFERRRNEGNHFQSDKMYEYMLSDFESNTQMGKTDIIGLGFNRISQLVGQCSVYPLAIEEGGRTHHPFVDIDGNPIDKTTDLCGDKGTYWVNDRLFQSTTSQFYPLAYEMAVVYHRPADIESCQRYEDGCSKGQLFVDKLLTPEGQYLLSEVGLVPMLSIQKIRQILWSPIATGDRP